MAHAFNPSTREAELLPGRVFYHSNKNESVLASSRVPRGGALKGGSGKRLIPRRLLLYVTCTRCFKIIIHPEHKLVLRKRKFFIMCSQDALRVQTPAGKTNAILDGTPS